MQKKQRKLRPEILLIFCTLLVIVFGIILVVPTMLNDAKNEIVDAELHDKMISEDNISDLLAQKNINIGESAKIRTLLRDSLPAGLFLNTFDITLDKLTIKYTLTERSESTQEDYDDFWKEDNAKQIIMYNTTALFVLVRNLDVIEIDVAGYEFPTCIITRSEAEAAFNIGSLTSIGNAADWQSVLIDHGVYNDDIMSAFFEGHPLTAAS
jgi:hypothetical protein